MKLPPDVFIAPEKLTRYLLVPQARGDKAAFLKSAGYTLGNTGDLVRDLLTLAQQGDAILQEDNIYGRVFEIHGQLIGPNGVTLSICAIWMTEHLSGQTKFITLFPDKRSRKP